MIIHDNYLEKEVFDNLKNTICSQFFPWYKIDGIAEQYDSKDIFLTHLFYENYTKNSDFFDLLNPLIQKVKPKAIIRARTNMYYGAEKLIKHKSHSDYPFKHKGVILYINSNDGFTEFENGEKVECVENRVVFFDPHKKHSSSNCTNNSFRIVLTMNYF